MTTFTPEMVGQLAEMIGPAIVKKIEDQMAPTMASYNQRIQQAEAANAVLNTQMAQLSAQQALFFQRNVPVANTRCWMTGTLRWSLSSPETRTAGTITAGAS